MQLRLQKCWSTHNVRHEGGNATHLKEPDADAPICGTPMQWCETGEEVEVTDARNVYELTDCARCAKKITRLMSPAGCRTKPA